MLHLIGLMISSLEIDLNEDLGLDAEVLIGFLSVMAILTPSNSKPNLMEVFMCPVGCLRCLWLQIFLF